MTLHLGILLALASAFVANLAFFYKHRGARQVPAVDVRHPLRSAGALWRSKWFALGMVIGGGAWLFHVAAISLAPLSVVQAVISGGVVMIGVIAERLFGFQVGPRQRWGLALTAIGLILLVVTMPAHAGGHTSFSLAAMIAFEAGLFGIGALLMLGPRIGGRAEHHGIMLAAAAGLLFGVCNIGVKAVSGEAFGGGGALGILLSPWALVAICGSVGAFYASARSLQVGEAIAVIAITGTTANIASIAGGILVFGDPMPGDALGVVLQSLAFVLVIVASALTPAPVRAATARA